jgi:hypothetical protein
LSTLQFEKASLHTIEDLQTFGNNFVPSPFWVRVIRVVVPLSTQLDAGRILIDTLGEDEVVDVIGGKEWWQRTAHKTGGVDGEWISMKRDWQGLDAEGDDNEELEKLRDEKIKKMKESAKQDKKRRWKEGKHREEQAEAGSAEGGDESVPEIREEESYSAEMDEMRRALSSFRKRFFDFRPSRLADISLGPGASSTFTAELTFSVASTLTGKLSTHLLYAERTFTSPQILDLAIRSQDWRSRFL